MAERYLGSFTETNEFKVQELTRILDATLETINPEGLHTGSNAISIIAFLSSFPGFSKFVTPEFYEHIREQLKLSGEKENVREHVKKILTYPRTGYLPWVNFIINPEIIEEIREEVCNITFKISLIDGKVYALCISEKKLNEVVFNHVKESLNFLEQNTESCHITIVNSNIVSDIGESDVEAFISEFDKEFTVTIGNIKSTFSEDWSRFGECYVIEVQCTYIDDFLFKFNQRFNKNIKIAKHTTFAIKPRSLWQ